MLKTILAGVIIASGIILIVSVLVQQKGGGLGAAFGGDSGAYRTKRGAEKLVFYLTIVMAVIFIGTILVTLIIK